MNKKKTGLALLVAFAFLAGSVQARNEDLVPFEDGGKWGYRTCSGAVIVPPRFDLAWTFLETGIAAVIDEKGWAYIDRDGSVLLRPFVFDNGPDDFAEGLARFVEDGKIGFFDRSGRIVIDARFEWVEPFSQGHAVFCEGCVKMEEGEHYRMSDGRWGAIDRAGTVIAEPH